MLAAIPFRYVCTYYVGQICSRYQLNLEGRLYYLKENRVAGCGGPIQFAWVYWCTQGLGGWSAMVADGPHPRFFWHLGPQQTIHGDCG